MKKGLTLALALGALAAAASVAAVTERARPEAATASSHREAPLIAKDPAADNTDLYAFVSPDKPDTVTIVANYIPLEEPAGGPNFAASTTTCCYEINIDNDGDGEEDITYQFRFKTRSRNPNTFLYNTGPITSLDDPTWNVRQTYRSRASTTASRDGARRRLPDAAGQRRPALDAELRGARRRRRVQTLDGRHQGLRRPARRSVLRRPRLDLRPGRPAAVQRVPPDPAADASGVDGVGGFNIHTIAIQVPIDQLTHDQQAAPKPKAVIGIYASASRQQVTRPDATAAATKPAASRCRSRAWATRCQRGDHPARQEGLLERARPGGGQRSSRVLHEARAGRAGQPALPGAPGQARPTTAHDLVAVLLTGVPGLNVTRPDAARRPAAAEHRHPADGAVGNGNRLGVLGGRPRRLPERPPAGGRRDRHRAAGGGVGYGDVLNRLLGLPQPQPEQPDRRRRGRERSRRSRARSRTSRGRTLATAPRERAAEGGGARVAPPPFDSISSPIEPVAPRLRTRPVVQRGEGTG